MLHELAMFLTLGLTIGTPMFVAMFPLTGWTIVVLSLHAGLVYWWPLLGIIVASLVSIWRLWMAMPSAEETWPTPDKSAPRSRVLVVLGSGGHTTEMIYDLSTVEEWRDKFDATYIIADTDKKSLAPANEFENGIRGRDAKTFRIPRPREVGQSFISSVIPTLRATLVTMHAIFVVWPDVVVCNGPGTCVPVVIAAYVPRFFRWKRIAIIYSESLACVGNLSLSGSLLFQFNDVMTVQWDPLCRSLKYRSKYGHLLHGGRCRDGEKLEALPLEAQEGDGTAIVTVGSTKFEDLIKSIDNAEFIGALVALGIKKLKVQKGNGVYEPAVITGDAAREAGIESEVVEYERTLPDDLRAASLIISHAGAGTVLDGLNNSRRMLVVPNEGLMDNHQVQLCEELKKYGLVRWSKCSDIISTLEGYTGADLKKFPDKPTPTFASALRHVCGRPNKEELEERKKARRNHYDRYGYDRY